MGLFLHNGCMFVYEFINVITAVISAFLDGEHSRPATRRYVPRGQILPSAGTLHHQDTQIKT